MALPLNDKQTRTAVRWLVTNFREPLERAVEGTPLSIELLCGIACQETAFLWLPFVAKQMKASEVLARSIGDAFSDMLIAEANASRVRVFTDIARDEIGRMLAEPQPPAVPEVVSAPAARGRSREAARPAPRATTARSAAAAARPQITQADLRRRLDALGINRTLHPVVVVGIRGFYSDAMGAPGVNVEPGGPAVHPDQWEPFIAMAVDQAKRWHGTRWDKVVIPYALPE